MLLSDLGAFALLKSTSMWQVYRPGCPHRNFKISWHDQPIWLWWSAPYPQYLLRRDLAGVKVETSQTHLRTHTTLNPCSLISPKPSNFLPWPPPPHMVLLYTEDIAGVFKRLIQTHLNCAILAHWVIRIWRALLMSRNSPSWQDKLLTVCEYDFQNNTRSRIGRLYHRQIAVSFLAMPPE